MPSGHALRPVSGPPVPLAAIPLWWATDELETGIRVFLWALAALLLTLAV